MPLKIGYRRLSLTALLIIGCTALAGGIWFYLNKPRSPTYSDVTYASPSPSQKLDVYLPAGSGPFPVVIFAHGGAFKFGDKRETFGSMGANIRAINDAGIAYVSINYRMSGETPFPAAVQDMKSALRFLRAHAATYHLDPDHIALWGKSAGGNIALMAGLSRGQPLFDDPHGPPASISDRVSGVISMYGPTDFAQMDTQLKASGCDAADISHNQATSPESLYLGAQITTIPQRVAQSNPMTYVGADTPPLLLQHGSKDCTVPHQQSEILRDAVLKRAPHPDVTFNLLDGAQHGDGAFEAPANLARVLAFLQHRLHGTPSE